MTETPFFFGPARESLFGILHQPEQPAGSAVVLCHPFAEEKLWAHRVFVTFARRLAARGVAVLRFDYMGNGDSGGSFSASSLATACADVKCAAGEVQRRTGADGVTLVGLRMGATIASLVAEDLAAVRRLVLWSPIVDGGRYMQELLRINLTTQMAVYKEVRYDREALAAQMQGGATVNVDGYEMAHPMFSEVSAVKLAQSRKQFQGPSLVVQIDRAPGRPSPELKQVADAYTNGTFAFAQEEPFWKEIARFYDIAPNLFDVTLDWLESH